MENGVAWRGLHELTLCDDRSPDETIPLEGGMGHTHMVGDSTD